MRLLPCLAASLASAHALSLVPGAPREDPKATAKHGHDQRPAPAKTPSAADIERDVPSSLLQHLSSSAPAPGPDDFVLSPELRRELVWLHKKLVDAESISGNERPLGDWLASYLKGKGFDVTMQEVGSEPGAGKKRANVLAHPPGAQRATRVLATSHIDTVPPFIPYAYHPSNNTISGRGSVDAKACVAAQIVAVLSLLDGSGPPSVSLLFVVSEETGGQGMKHFSSSALNPMNYRAVVFGEPTESKLVAGHKGILEFHLHATGRAAHSGYPWLGVSATDVLVDLLAELKSLERAGKLGTSRKYGNTTLNIGTMSGGVAANVIPSSADASIAMRIASGPRDSLPLPQLKALLHETVRRHAERVRPAGGDVRLEFAHQGYGPVDMSCDVPGFECTTVNYGTDVPNLEGGHKRYLYGPGTIFVAHSENEGLKVDDLVGSVAGYRRLILAGLGEEGSDDIGEL